MMLYRWDGEGDTLELPYVTSGRDAIRGNGELDLRSSRARVLRKIATEKAPYFQSDVPSDRLLVNLKADGRPSKGHRTFAQRQGVVSFAGVPLVTRADQLLGILCLNYRQRRAFREEERRLLRVFARQAVSAMEENLSQHMIRRQLVEQERERLARNLHETVLQHLHAVGIQLDAVAESIVGRDPDRVDEYLLRARTMVVRAIDVGREMIARLARDRKAEANFVWEIRESIRLARDVHSAQIAFDHSVYAGVPPAVQFYLLRIAIEALSNALRHSGASVIHVVYDVSKSGAVHLTVSDDGKGFELCATHADGVGLAIMKESAKMLGAELCLHSCAGEGTKVTARWEPR